MIRRILFVVFITVAMAYSHSMPGNSKNMFYYITGQYNGEPQSIIEMANIKAGELIDSFYRKRHKNDGFNGAVVVAKDGNIIYSNSFGFANLQSKEPLTLQSSFQLASVSKTFTATAILLLAENGFLSLDDSIQKFFPRFPYKGITIKNLLSHRTGLPEYTCFPKEFFGTKESYITNNDVVNMFMNKKPALRCKADHMFIYCNSNYALLASIVEVATQMSFGQFMNEVIFKPLGMTNSFVYDPNDTTQSALATYDSKWHPWKNNIYDGVVGDKGIYSSAEDMLKWDNALREGLVLNRETLVDAYSPKSLDKYSFVGEKEKNYGYGWRMTKQTDKTYLIYHNGFWHGANNVFARDIDDGYTIIVLGNKSNQNNYWTQPVWDVLYQLKEVQNIAEVQ